jgi:hypothetical protein
LTDESSHSLDLLWGCGEIAAFIKRPVRPTYYLLEAGMLPARKTGKVWTATKSGLREHFAKVPPPPEAEAAEVASPPEAEPVEAPAASAPSDRRQRAKRTKAAPRGDRRRSGKARHAK